MFLTLGIERVSIHLLTLHLTPISIYYDYWNILCLQNTVAQNESEQTEVIVLHVWRVLCSPEFDVINMNLIICVFYFVFVFTYICNIVIHTPCYSIRYTYTT